MPAISAYSVVHKLGGTTTLDLLMVDGTSAQLPGFSVAEAGYLIDLLRNEKPINFNPATKVIAFGAAEPVGEGE